MLKKFGFKKGEPKESEARVKLQKELFAYNKLVEHGFPNKPSAIAYDPKLKLLAIGTKTGDIKVVGQPGVEVRGQHEEEVTVNQLFFLPEQGRLISSCSDNSLHLWEINDKAGRCVLEDKKQISLEQSKLKTISTCCLSGESDVLLVGTEGGNIHVLDVGSFTLREQVIYQDVVMQNVSDDFKVNPGAVESIQQSPTDPAKFVVGYNRGLLVLWDLKESNADQTYNATQQLEALTWYRDGTQFMSAHADGSYVVWSSTDSTKPKEQPNTPYGPFPCKAISTICWGSAKANNVVVFAGGMPRPAYADRHTVSVTQGVKQVVYDFTSRVVDFIVLTTSQELDDPTKPEHDDPHTVLVLAEEELVAIDLTSKDWPILKQPYLCSLHSSAVTAATHVDNVPEGLWKKIADAGEVQNAAYSSRDWPIKGGKITKDPPSSRRDLLLTGHEDGSVRFWDVSGSSLSLLYRVTTSSTFGLEFQSDGQDADEEWPPFRKVGTFDPYSDDPRLGIQKVALCPDTETLVVGGTAGQILVMNFNTEDKEVELSATTVNIVSDRDNFVWKGHEALKPAEAAVAFPGGFQTKRVMQLHPPAAVTALAVQAEWEILAAGTAHGFGIFDYAQGKEITTKCTLNPNDMTGTGDSAMARRKSFKKSLRESFRRLRKRRSERRRAAEEKEKESKGKKEEEKKKKKEEVDTKKEEKKEEKKEGEAAAEGAAAAAAEGGETAAVEGEAAAPAEAAATAEEPAAAAAAEPAGEVAAIVEDVKEAIKEVAKEEAKEEAKEAATSIEEKLSPITTPTSEGRGTVERSVEFRNSDDSMASMVRTLYFTDTFLFNATTHTPTLWAGTNSGRVFVYQIVVPTGTKRTEEEVTAQIGKEIHLKHGAPVVNIRVLDRSAVPLPVSTDASIEGAKEPDMTAHHQVLICSEEQFKIFSLPALKPQNKYKLTAHEGAKVRRAGLARFSSRSDSQYVENDLVVLTNQGDVHVFSVPQLRRQLRANAIRKENVNGIVTSVLSRDGEGFFSSSASELTRFSLSSALINDAFCQVELAEGMRVPEPEPEVAEEPEVTPAVEAGAGAEATEAASPTAANDSTLTADLTIDSVKVHLSEEDAEKLSNATVVSQSFTRSVVTKTSMISSSGEATKITETKTKTMTTDDGSGPRTVTETITNRTGGD